MAQRPKRSVPRRDYASLADLKLPRIKKSNNHSTPRLSDSEGEANGELYRVEVVEENTATSQVKVRYIGYSTSFDEWREKEEIVDLSDSDSEDDVPEFPSVTIQRFCLLQELAVRIKQSLISSRKGNPVCHIVMSFDKIFFDSLAVRGALQSKAGRSSRVHTRQVYTIPHMKHFEDLLGARWYIRGLNMAGDFCFVTPSTVEFYLRETKGKVDYQLESDGSMRQFYFGKGCQLVFSFVRGDGILRQWNDIIRLCSS